MALETKYDQILKAETQSYFNFINSIDSEETYAPITKKNIQIGTKLPQKSIPDKEFSYYT